MKFPPATGAHGSDTQKAQALARYMAVRTLSDKAAAKKLGVQIGTVRDYRRHHPDTRPEGWATGVQGVRKPVEPPKPQRASGGPEKAVWRKEVPMASGGVRTISVSLQGPPQKEPRA